MTPRPILDLYPEVDADTLSFPSHSAEFRFGGDILVDYEVSGDSATFDVQLPSDCDDACLDAHAWAVSAFFGPHPWTRSEESIAGCSEALRPHPTLPKVARPAGRYVWIVTPDGIERDSTSSRSCVWPRSGKSRSPSPTMTG